LLKRWTFYFEERGRRKEEEGKNEEGKNEEGKNEKIIFMRYKELCLLIKVSPVTNHQ
jgi:hypothetical protein